MSLNNKTIETLSVSAVKNSIITSELLEPFISDNDLFTFKEVKLCEISSAIASEGTIALVRSTIVCKQSKLGDSLHSASI